MHFIKKDHIFISSLVPFLLYNTVLRYKTPLYSKSKSTYPKRLSSDSFKTHPLTKEALFRNLELR